jgi:hypothetical protein
MFDSRAILIGIAAGMFITGDFVIAQEQEPHHPEKQIEQGKPDTNDGVSGPMTHGTMHGGMQGCEMMQGRMGGMMADAMMDRMIHIPKLPPGNEKLQLMMQAEILQKVGEVQAKYAAQLIEPAP